MWQGSAAMGSFGSEADHLRSARSAAYENSRPEVRRHVPLDRKRVLDLGCSSGAVGAALKADGVKEVVGLELDPVYADRASARLDEVLNVDLEDFASKPGGTESLGEFDCLLAGDILEHLRDPWEVLRRFSAQLSPGGIAIVSLPNVRHWRTFWHLGVRGTWPRHEMGIFDRDHLRWFTASDGIALLRQAGLSPEVVNPVYRFGEEPSDRDRIARRLGRTRLRPFFTFQLILVGRRIAEA